MDIKIGKFTLETLTTGMYDSPKDMYREYIQNCVDSIDNAVELGLLSKGNELISIDMNKELKTITIKDNGTGIRSLEANDLLLSIGSSKKLSTKERGFRGIGRLAGLAYCDELIFETSYKGEETKTKIVFNANRLREELYSLDQESTIGQILSEVTIVEREREIKGKHYFTVTLNGVADIDGILNFEEMRTYLAQVAPVPFSPAFKWGEIIRSKTRYLGYDIIEYNIVLKSNNQQSKLFKMYSDKFIADRLRKNSDSISDVDVSLICHNNNPLAILWYAKTNFSGTIQDNATKSIRLRKGNIQLGTRVTLNSVFKDERFNGWMIGELYVLSNALIPNARRDDLEKNDTYYILMDKMKAWADSISSNIRKISLARNAERVNTKLEEQVSSGDKISSVQLQQSILPEIELTDKQEYDEVAHTELINQLDQLINQESKGTKYKILNMQSGLTVEQKRILEAVFDVLCENEGNKADSLISTIIKGYKEKLMVHSTTII